MISRPYAIHVIWWIYRWCGFPRSQISGISAKTKTGGDTYRELLTTAHSKRLAYRAGAPYRVISGKPLTARRVANFRYRAGSRTHPKAYRGGGGGLLRN